MPVSKGNWGDCIWLFSFPTRVLSCFKVKDIGEELVWLDDKSTDFSFSS